MSVQAIAEVGEALLDLLRNKIQGLNSDNARVASPAEVQGQDVRLTVFLYSIEETITLRNEERIFDGHDKLAQPPLYLDLHYMLTTYPTGTSADPSERNFQAHRLMGMAMRVLKDNGILRVPSPTGEQQPRVSVFPLSMEDWTRLWGALPNIPMLPSVCYLVTPIRIDAEDSLSIQRVVEKEVNADYLAPPGAT